MIPYGMNCALSVSYTHLDVYKRQAENNIAQGELQNGRSFGYIRGNFSAFRNGKQLATVKIHGDQLVAAVIAIHRKTVRVQQFHAFGLGKTWERSPFGKCRRTQNRG